MSNKKSELNFEEREEISKGMHAFEKSIKIARRLGRSPGAASREIKKQVKRKRWCYPAINGLKIAEENKSRRGRKNKIESNPALKEYVHCKLKNEWSPEEIANRLKKIYVRIEIHFLFYLTPTPYHDISVSTPSGALYHRTNVIGYGLYVYVDSWAY